MTRLFKLFVCLTLILAIGAEVSASRTNIMERDAFEQYHQGFVEAYKHSLVLDRVLPILESKMHAVCVRDKQNQKCQLLKQKFHSARIRKIDYTGQEEFYLEAEEEILEEEVEEGEEKEKYEDHVQKLKDDLEAFEASSGEEELDEAELDLDDGPVEG